MCIRQALGKAERTGADGTVHPARGGVPLSCFEEFCVEWASRWCITASGRAQWRLAAWEAMVLSTDPESRARIADPAVGLHIQLAEHVDRHGVRPGIEEHIKQHSGNTILLATKVSTPRTPLVVQIAISNRCPIAPHATSLRTHRARCLDLAHTRSLWTRFQVTVVLPFATDAQIAEFQAMVAKFGVASAKGQQAPKTSKTRAAGWLSILTMSARSSTKTGALYEYVPTRVYELCTSMPCV